MKNGDYKSLYEIIRKGEAETKDILIEFQDDYPKVLNESNMDDILKRLKDKRNNN